MPVSPPGRERATARLHERRATLRAEIAAVDDELANAPSRQPHSQVEDSGEQGEERIRAAVRAGESDRDIAELRDVDEALALIDLGVYGSCIDCGRDIAPARLEVQPWSLRCITCQEIFDRSHASGARMASP